MSKMNDSDLLRDLQKKQYGFGQSLRTVRKNQGLTIREVADEVKRTSTYISDIERGINKPPNADLIDKIVKVLNKHETEIESYLYDLAAKERGGVSGDISKYIMDHNDLRLVIRMVKQRQDGEKIWSECLKRIQ